MQLIILAFAMGIVTGLRASIPLAALSWAARFGWISLSGTPLAFMALPLASYLTTAGVVFELIGDKLPMTPSRKELLGFASRIVIGGFAGAVLSFGLGSVWIGIVFGVAGGIAGTLGGHAARAKLAIWFGRDFPAALLEDLVAIAASILIVSHAS